MQCQPFHPTCGQRPHERPFESVAARAPRLASRRLFAVEGSPGAQRYTANLKRMERRSQAGKSPIRRRAGDRGRDWRCGSAARSCKAAQDRNRESAFRAWAVAPQRPTAAPVLPIDRQHTCCGRVAVHFPARARRPPGIDRLVDGNSVERRRAHGHRPGNLGRPPDDMSQLRETYAVRRFPGGSTLHRPQAEVNTSLSSLHTRLGQRQ